MELGSNFNLDLSDLTLREDNIFSYLSEYDHVLYFDSGRSALRHLVKKLGGRYDKVLLPEFICSSVARCFERSRISYYRLREDFSPDIESISAAGPEGSIIYVMHYFGSVQDKNLLSAIRTMADDCGSLIIEDSTHSIFSAKKTIGDFMVASIRKWLPLSGGVLYYDGPYEEKPFYHASVDNEAVKGMVLKDMYLKNLLDCNSLYREIFEKSEEALDRQKDIRAMSDLSKFIASCIGIDDLITKRRENYSYLKERLSERGIKPALELKDGETPLVFPLRLHNRDSLRSYLMEKKIYCAVHWPFYDHLPEMRPFARRNADELLSLPIDQRYDRDHMDYLLKALDDYGGNLKF